MRRRLVVELSRDLLELHGLWVELGGLQELEEEVGQALSEACEALFGAAAVQHVCLTVDQVHDLTGQVAIEFLHRPLHVQQNVEALVDGEERQSEAAVEVHELLSAGCVGGVHGGRLAIVLGPDLRVRHGLQLFLDFGVAVVRLGVDLQLIDGLQELGFLMEQLSLCCTSRSLVESGFRDSVGLVEPPGLELAVKHREVLQGLRLHPSLHLSLVPQIGLELAPLLLLRSQLLPTDAGLS
mmetsp:Transcript_91487/g.191240  ORF Transcript_91487/g.191240 Transcript_91487/m.191240 type:complete len:239 (+) Transcript_91487:270-986(+)